MQQRPLEDIQLTYLDFRKSRHSTEDQVPIFASYLARKSATASRPLMSLRSTFGILQMSMSWSPTFHLRTPRLTPLLITSLKTIILPHTALLRVCDLCWGWTGVMNPKASCQSIWKKYSVSFVQLMITLQSAQPNSTEGNVADAARYVQAGIPVGRAATVELRNQHAVYAATWYVMRSCLAEGSCY